uniref:Uncharacterized protein n=1 Tax=viral metagenome TaxID=1070528 RepID=A0A6M3XVL3_9ZZZZ
MANVYNKNMNTKVSPKEAVGQIMEAQGRRWNWLAEQIAEATGSPMHDSTLHRILTGMEGHRLTPELKAIIAGILGEPINVLFPR